MKNIIIVALILCANARTSHVFQFTNFVKNATGYNDSLISDKDVPVSNSQKSKQFVQEPITEEEPMILEEEPYPEEEGPAPPEEPYVPEEEPYLPEEDPNLPEQPYMPEEEPLLPDEQPSLPEQPFEGEPESW
jgi:hypothetical protein